MSLEALHSLFQIGSVVLLGLTFFVGAGALITGNRLNRQQAERLRTFDADLTAAKLALADQQVRAAAAEKELLELKERARPRTLDEAARAEIIAALPVGTHLPIAIHFVSGSTREPRDFAAALRDVLTQGGWNVVTFDGGPAIGTPPDGILLQIAEGAEADREAAEGLQFSLRKGGLAPRIVLRTDRKPGTIVLLVGLKP